MTDPTDRPDPHDDTGGEFDPGSPPRVPDWVKAFGVVLGVLVLVWVILQLTGVGGEHGPGQHGHQARAPAAAVVDTHLPAEPPDGRS